MKRTFAIMLALVMLLTTAAFPVHATESTSNDREEIIELACKVFPEYESAIRWENTNANPYSRSSQELEVVHREERQLSDNKSMSISLLSSGGAIVIQTEFADDINYTEDITDIGTIGFAGSATFEVVLNDDYFELSDVRFTVYDYYDDCFSDYGTVTANSFTSYSKVTESSTLIEYHINPTYLPTSVFPFSVYFSDNQVKAYA